jgi:hypothetical protein
MFYQDKDRSVKNAASLLSYPQFVAGIYLKNGREIPAKS